MSHEEIIRAWKDSEYRVGLSSDQMNALPQHPAGLIEISDDNLLGVTGGAADATGKFLSAGCPCKTLHTNGSCRVFTAGCCRQPTP